MEPAVNPFVAINTVLAATRLPDGSRMKQWQKHTLLTLACHYPNCEPGQHRLATELLVTRSTVNVRLRQLEKLGLIKRYQRGYNVTTRYRLNLSLLRQLAD